MSPRKWRYRLQDMLNAARKIVGYVEGLAFGRMRRGDRMAGEWRVVFANAEDEYGEKCGAACRTTVTMVEKTKRAPSCPAQDEGERVAGV